jgi:hypothetical protein
MPNFFSVDDGLSFISVSLIDAFGHESEEPHKGGTWIRLKDGTVLRTSRLVDQVAEKLGSVNLWY